MNFVNKQQPISTREWDEIEEDTFKSLTKEEMDALRKAKPRNFASINSWWIVLSQVVLTLVIAGACFVFSSQDDKSVYTYSALVGGLIGFLPDLKWIPLLVTYLATLKCYLLGWFWK